jgi:hypothetical protein
LHRRHADVLRDTGAPALSPALRSGSRRLRITLRTVWGTPAEDAYDFERSMRR